MTKSKNTLKDEVIKICEQLYTIGVDDGKGGGAYFPTPEEWYADKLITLLKKNNKKKETKKVHLICPYCGKEWPECGDDSDWSGYDGDLA